MRNSFLLARSEHTCTCGRSGWQHSCTYPVRKVRKVLGWIEHGVPLKWTNPHSEAKKKEPMHERKRRGVLAMLTGVLGSYQKALDVLKKKLPESMVFPNRIAPEDLPFAGEAVEALAKVKAAVIFDKTGKTRPKIVHSLSVARDSKGKPRLCLDCRYLNLFLEYCRFYYEKLSDVKGFLKEGDYFFLGDFKSGYHHIPMAKEDWTYLGFEFEGKYYVFTVLPFGLSTACWMDLHPSYGSCIPASAVGRHGIYIHG